MNKLRVLLALALCALVAGVVVDYAAAQQAEAVQPAAIDELASTFTQPPGSHVRGSTGSGSTATSRARNHRRPGSDETCGHWRRADHGSGSGRAGRSGGLHEPEWRDLFQHVQQESQRLGLEVNMNNDAGWNGSGGPWITPDTGHAESRLERNRGGLAAAIRGLLPSPSRSPDSIATSVCWPFPTTGDYRIDRIQAKAMFEVGGVGGIAATNCPRRCGSTEARS